jgi:histidine triad (HIT) family protein
MWIAGRYRTLSSVAGLWTEVSPAGAIVLFIIDEVQMTDTYCLFCKIASGEINADVIYENDYVMAFRDINPQAPTHVLVIPRKHIATINELVDTDQYVAGALHLAAKDIAKQEGIAEDGFRTVMNCNSAAGQTVFHIHLHVLGGRDFSWPPG